MSVSSWDQKIFALDANVDFLDELSGYEPDEAFEAVADACTLAFEGAYDTREEQLNGLAAATLLSIWAGCPVSDGELVEQYPFVGELMGSGDEELREKAAELLSDVETDADIDQFIEALG